MKEEEINRDERDGRDKYREELINEKVFLKCFAIVYYLLNLQPIIPLEELALDFTSFVFEKTKRSFTSHSVTK